MAETRSCRLRPSCVPGWGRPSVLNRVVMSIQAVVTILCATSVVGCSVHAQSGNASAPTDQESPILMNELRRLTPKRFGRFDETRVDLRSDSLPEIPGLQLRWGVYRPPETADIQIVALVAAAGGRRSVLREPADWRRLLTQCWPQSAASAIDVCRGVIATTGPRRDPYRQPIKYSDSLQLRNLSIALPDAKPAWLTDASAGRSGNEQWQVAIGVFEPGRAARYSCRLSRADGATLEVTDSLPGAGLLPSTP